MAKVSITMIAKRLLLIGPLICAIVLCGCWRESGRRAECANNLRQMWFVFKMYADEWDGKFPPIDDGRGNLMVDGDAVFPEYGRTSLLDCTRCPSNRYHATAEGLVTSDNITDRSYFYLGWVVTSEDEGVLLLDKYELLDLTHRDNDIHLSRDERSIRLDTIFRIREGIERYFIAEKDIQSPAAAAKAQDRIPVVWERPGNHSPAGGHVLYMSGRVEFVEHPGKFPMTPGFVNRLVETSAAKGGKDETTRLR